MDFNLEIHRLLLEKMPKMPHMEDGRMAFKQKEGGEEKRTNPKGGAVALERGAACRGG